MAALIGMPRAAWKRQPKNDVSVDWQHPLAERLHDLFLPSSYRSFGLGKTPTVIDTFAQTDQQNHRMFAANVRQQTARIEYSATPYVLSSNFTLYAIFNINNTAETVNSGLVGRWIGASGGAVSQRSYLLGVDYQSVPNTPYILGGLSSNGSFQAGGYIRGATALSEKTLYHSAYAVTLGGRKALYLNGRVDNENSTSTPSSIHVGTSPLWLGQNFTITNETDFSNLNGGIAFIVIWRRALADFEMTELYKNPWQLLKPRIARFISIPATMNYYIPRKMYHYFNH